MQKLILRADGSSKIGYGHIFRVLAFGEWYASKYACILVTSAPDTLTINAARNSGIAIHTLESQPADASAEEQAFDMEDVLDGSEIVVTDGYRFGSRYQEQIKEKGCTLVCIDDEAKWHFLADAIVNPAPSVQESTYNKQPYSRLFYGKDYFILRKCFLVPLPARESRANAVYISAGGADQYGLTNKLASLVLANTSMGVHILYSSSFSEENMAALNNLRQAYAGRVVLHCNLSGPEVVAVIDTCTHAIVSSSTVSLEVVARGIKPLLGYYVPNQMGIYNGMLKEGMAYGLGSFHEFDTASIKTYLAGHASSGVKVCSGIDKILSEING